MTPRPTPLAAKSRPLSAIYIGPSSSTCTSTPPSLPDLPEPLSPLSSSSGLPSPPATNSTGSGSAGDNEGVNSGSLRQRTGSRPNSNPDMSNGNYGRRYSRSRSRPAFTDDEDDGSDRENDEDNTARLSGGRRASSATPNDNASALQRVKNLAQRNRMVLDKLSSMSRLSSPVPSSQSRSPMTPASAGSSSSSSRPPSAVPRPQSASNPLPANGRYPEPSHSGSETERESQRFSTYSYPSSEDLSATPPTHPNFGAPPPLRERRISAPASPAKGTRPLRDRDRGPSPGPSRTPKKRRSVAADEIYRTFKQEDDQDVTTAALAAVASSRRSPTGSSGKRNRQPLPREFRERDRRSLDGKSNGESSTPYPHSDRNSPTSPRASRTNLSTVQTSPRRPGSVRYSTVRELTRKHQTRWLSEDLSTPGDGEDEAHKTPSHSNGPIGTRQGHRGGSSDAMLLSSGGRSLVSEGLRAAGLTRRHDLSDDPFSGGDNVPISPRRTKSTGNSSVAHGDWEPSPGVSRGVGSSSRVTEGPPNGSHYEPRTPAPSSQRSSHRNGYSAGLSRPGTSMAALHHENGDLPPPRPTPSLRPQKSSYSLAEREKVTSPRTQDGYAQHSSDRAYSSPFAAYRPSPIAQLPPGTSPGPSRDSNAEHRRLMLEALGMFESHLQRLPSMGHTTTNTIPELFQNAQHVVHALDKLNGMLKSGTNRALEAQIEAEVADTGESGDMAELWRSVGSEHRESLRASDDIVRYMTGFLLGVGKVIRETSALHGQQQHLRTMSLDDEAARRTPSDVTPASSTGGPNGRKSRETRRSWDPRELRESASRLSSRERSHVRPGSSLLMKGSATSSSEGRSVAEAVGEQTPQTVRNVSHLGASSSIRRLYITRDQRATPEALAPIKTSFNAQDSPGNYEPSPTPTSRTSHSAISERTRALPPVAVPPSLSTLPSESLLNRSDTSASERSSRRKVSNNSNITVRAEPSAFTSVIKPPNATTALTTHTVSMLGSPAEIDQYPQPSPQAITRSESSNSARSNGVTFSRPSTVSMSTLSGVQHRDERTGRLHVLSKSNPPPPDDEPPVRLALAPAMLNSPMSGSETERPESWRRTIATRPRASIDSQRGMDSIEEVRGSGRTATMSGSLGRKERRRTITEIFQR